MSSVPELACLDPEKMRAAFLVVLVDSWGKTPSTASTYSRSIRDFITRMRITDLRSVTVETIDSYIGRLTLAKFSLNTRRNRYHALRSWFRWLTTRGHLSKDPTAEARPLPQRFMEKIPVFSRQELARLSAAQKVEEPKRGKKEPIRFFQHRLELHRLIETRDTAILELMYDLALRVGEPSLLERRDYDEVRGTVDIRGAKWQTEPESFPILPSTKAAMSVYLFELGRSSWSQHPALFPPIGARRGDTRRKSSGVGPGAIAMILKKRIARAKIDARGRRLSAHALRYSRATHYDEDGVPLLHIQVLLRHRALSTTQRYIRLQPVKRIKFRADRAGTFRRHSSPDSSVG